MEEYKRILAYTVAFISGLIAFYLIIQYIFGPDDGILEKISKATPAEGIADSVKIFESVYNSQVSLKTTIFKYGIGAIVLVPILYYIGIYANRVYTAWLVDVEKKGNDAVMVAQQELDDVQFIGEKPLTTANILGPTYANPGEATPDMRATGALEWLAGESQGGLTGGDKKMVISFLDENLTYSKADEYCKNINLELASRNNMVKSYHRGNDNARQGWIKNYHAFYPMQPATFLAAANNRKCGYYNKIEVDYDVMDEPAIHTEFADKVTKKRFKGTSNDYKKYRDLASRKTIEADIYGEVTAAQQVARPADKDAAAAALEGLVQARATHVDIAAARATLQEVLVRHVSLGDDDDYGLRDILIVVNENYNIMMNLEDKIHNIKRKLLKELPSWQYGTKHGLIGGRYSGEMSFGVNCYGQLSSYITAIAERIIKEIPEEEVSRLIVSPAGNTKGRRRAQRLLKTRLTEMGVVSSPNTAREDIILGKLNTATDKAGILEIIKMLLVFKLSKNKSYEPTCLKQDNEIEVADRGFLQQEATDIDYINSINNINLGTG